MTDRYQPTPDELRVIEWLNRVTSNWDRESASYWASQIEQGHHRHD